jgi:hypothetical protein
MRCDGSVCTFHLHAVDLRDGREVFLEVFDGVAHAGLLDVGESCCQLRWGAVCLWSLRGCVRCVVAMDVGGVPSLRGVFRCDRLVM